VKAMFANLTTADFRGRSQMVRRATERRRVHALFDVIQIAIHAGDCAAVDALILELAIATRECELEKMGGGESRGPHTEATGRCRRTV
jgi:hypothetical protein